ncbi:Mitochondrial GTPase 1 [Ceratocystis fimbriata CBS 114723]|uniref:Mitochondrial GTPase 1 n=1 Tax=Ceratocystis fimbriata CBS 114723 TaxID=1035309 RepID=A0A2C5WV97_9PEZI|nr:Mitochondrial GTPase 1 [Ceratocystis fimbriata CBS 114723]
MRPPTLACPLAARCSSISHTITTSRASTRHPRNSPSLRPPCARQFAHSPIRLSNSTTADSAPPTSPSPPQISATIPPVSTPSFTPRISFDTPQIRKSYFIGHHRAALRNIEARLSDIGLVIECRDARLPLTSWNPMLENVLSNCTQRIVAYTKCDLISESPHNGNIQAALGRFHASRPGSGKPIFLRKGMQATNLLNMLRDYAANAESLTGLRIFVVGMPNVGKSSLINMLRGQGMGAGGKAKVAPTANYPGVTRKLSSPVRVLGGKTRPQDNVPGEGVFVIDTPGVFIPYVADKEVMLKLALAHGIRDGIVPYETQADYLLYKMNHWNPKLYEHFCPPTNDVMELLSAVATKTGRLSRAAPGHEHHAAAWMVSQWRSGKLGRYPLEEVNKTTIQTAIENLEDPAISLSQAKKLAKEARQEIIKARRKAHS